MLYAALYQKWCCLCILHVKVPFFVVWCSTKATIRQAFEPMIWVQVASSWIFSVQLYSIMGGIRVWSFNYSSSFQSCLLNSENPFTLEKKRTSFNTCSEKKTNLSLLGSSNHLCTCKSLGWHFFWSHASWNVICFYWLGLWKILDTVIMFWVLEWILSFR